jgi:PAS domain S-box-containing protein
VNPFLTRLLGFSHGEMVGKTVDELSPFRRIESNAVMLERLQNDGYVRYAHLPLETRDGRRIGVEFIGSAYQAEDRDMIQCHVRDITEQRRVDCKPSTRTWSLFRTPFPTICVYPSAISVVSPGSW